MDKQTLMQYRYLIQEIGQLETEKQDLADRAIGAVKYSDMPKGSGTSDPTGELASKQIDLARVLAESLNKAVSLRLAIEAAIGDLEASERVLVRARYIEGLSWGRVTEKLYGDRKDFFDKFDSYLRQIYRYHGSALNKIG